MITLTRITDITSNEYRFTEELLTTIFPREEYRDLGEQRKNTAGKQAFHLMVVHYGTKPIGFVSYWHLGDFCYVEHLATHPDIRGNGLGRAIIEELKKLAAKIVLEVEEPIDETTNRRINFYRRAGFEISTHPYMQPPYRKGDGTLPMRLMFYGLPADKENFTKAQKVIYSNIYNYVEE